MILKKLLKELWSKNDFRLVTYIKFSNSMFYDQIDEELKQNIAKAKASLLKIQLAERKAKIQKIKY